MNKQRLSIFQSLKGTLLALMVVLAVVPAVAVGVIGATTTSSQLKVVKESELTSTVNVQHALIDDWLISRMREIESIATDDRIIEMDLDSAEDIVGKAMADFPY